MDLLQQGQKLGICFQKEEKLVEIYCTISKVFDDRINIELPQYFMRYIEYLEVGKRLTLKVFSKLGTIDFNGVIITSPLEDDFSVELDYNAMKLTPGEEIPTIEAFERLNIKVGNETISVKTIKISTETLCFYSDKQFKQDESFNCELILPKDYGTISFRATVIDVDDVYQNEYTVSYSYMNEYDRQSLLYYMYLYTNNINQNQDQI
jgi:hypothetical protein